MPESFFTSYLAFRDGIAQFIRTKRIDVPQDARIEQILDMSHATYLGRELDLGMTNYAARLLLGDDLPPIRPEPGGRRADNLCRTTSFMARGSPDAVMSGAAA